MKPARFTRTENVEIVIMDVRQSIRRACRLRLPGSVFLACALLVTAMLTSANSVPAQVDDIADVALDPGHSSWDVGATGGGLREYELTLDVAQRVRTLLEAQGFRVRLTREDSRRVAPSVPADPTAATEVEQGARIAAAGSARAFVSIHFNGHPDPSLRGTETYYNPENAGEQSFRLASELQRETVASISDAGYAATDRGVRVDLAAGKPYGHFFSLRGPFPSALVEVLFLTNRADADALHQAGVLDGVAQGIARGISSYLTTGSTAG
jgi:N-acetylmuramoyl-L-alanine amidase